MHTTTIDLTTDNLAIGWLIDRQPRPLTPAQRRKAIAIADQRDTFGTSRYGRMHRTTLIPGEHDRTAPADVVADIAPIVSLLVETLDRAGLSCLIPHLMAGLSISESARECGIPERTARHKIGEIRSALAKFIAAD